MQQPKTIVGLFQKQVAEQGSSSALLERRGDTWLSTSWAEWNERSRAVAAALIGEGVPADGHVGIFSYSRREWVEADIGILMSGTRTVTLYQNLSTETAHFILNDCQAPVVFAEGPIQLETLFQEERLPPTLRRIVYFTDKQKRLRPDENGRTPEVLLDKVTPEGKRDLLISYEEFIEQGKALLGDKPELLDERLAALTENSVAKVVYTSGTMGMPKGVMLTNGNVLFVVDSVEKGLGLLKSDLTLLFLPLAHVYAQLTYHSALKVGFKTAFARSMLTVMDDAASVKPHFFTSVPRLFEKIHAGVLRQIEDAGGLKEKIFKWATAVGSEVSRTKQAGKPVGGVLGAKLKVADKLVFSKIKARLGGRLRFMVSGGAPLPLHLAEFFHAADMLIIEGYGMTENASLSHYNLFEKYKFGTVGFPIPQMEHKIAADGEILMRGPNVMVGYLNNPELSAEAIDDEGWLHSGDVGTIDEQGFLKITDRKKQILVTSGGKNIPPAPIENALIASSFISQALVLGDKRKFLSALLPVDREYVEQWARMNNISYTDFEELVGKEDLVSRVQEEIDRVNARLDPFSRIKKFRLLPREFSIDSGELTPSVKLKRKVIEEHFCKDIEGMYPAESGEC